MSDEPKAPAEAAPARPGLGRDFATRAVSGIVLAAVALGLLFAGPKPFMLLVGLAAVLSSWEWSRIVRGPGLDAALIIHAGASGLAAALAGMGLAGLGLAATAVGAILAGLLSFGRGTFLSALGVVYTGLPAVALLWLREDSPYGLEAVLLLLLTVAATDIFAFLAGRLIGGPKLAPAISPNKTWSGLLGGVSAAAAAGALYAHWIGAAPLSLAIAGAGLGLVAQMGDLFESALKRRFGVKDSSQLIPGHGGVMDRIDGLVFAAAAAALVALVLKPESPATAVLFGG